MRVYCGIIATFAAPLNEAAPVGNKSKTPGVELEPAQISALIKNNRKAFDEFAQALRTLGLEACERATTKMRLRC
jgi:hypothetical protein